LNAQHFQKKPEILIAEEVDVLKSKGLVTVDLVFEEQQEQIELLELDKGHVRVSEYLTQLPSKEILAQKLHRAIEIARQKKPV